MVRTDPEPPPADPAVRAPAVLAVLVVKDGLPWLRDSLQGLSAQTHPRLGVVAVDNGSSDGSREALEQALGEGRVISLEQDRGVAGAVAAALEIPVAQEAEFLLVVHDDTLLEPDTVARLVTAAGAAEGVGVVGPKVVDWEDPRVLREVGRSTDRFGHPFTALQDGEFDHGQYDRVVEVLFVSSCAMLVRRDAWQRAGVPDERLGSHHYDLDFCWRARLAGFRVVMTPLARVRHLGATQRGRRRERGRHHGERYYAERASIAAMLKNYGLLSLAWLLPLYAVIGLGRLLLLTLSRRFEDAYELLAAWGWNLRHLPGTLRRRVRAQSVRSVRDRDVRRFMESAALRMPRWLEEASSMIVEGGEAEGDEEAALRARAGSLLRTHPVLLGAALGAVVLLLAAGRILGADELAGGVLPQAPFSPASYFGELVSGVRTTGLGGTQAGSPALGVFGAISTGLFGDPGLAQRALLVALPVLAGAMMYRATLRLAGERVGATIAAGSYALGAVLLWAFSQGRVDVLVALAALPVVVERLAVSFSADPEDRPARTAAGTGVALAIGVAFFPGMLLPGAVAAATQFLFAARRIRGSRITGVALLVAAVLVFPMLPALIRAPGPTIGSLVGEDRFSWLARLVLGPATGSWVIAWFLPLAALLSIAVVSREHRAAANRMAILAVAGVSLAWLSAAGWLPAPVSNPIAYVALSAVAEAFLVGFGIAAVVTGIGREAFGLRQLVAAALTFVLSLGLVLQSFAAIVGTWEVREGGLPAAWPVVSTSEGGEFRVLWVGRRSGLPFPAPGGDPRALLDAGAATIRYSITGRDGVSALDVGRGEFGDGYGYAERVLGELVGGTSRHVGALLAPLGVRFVVARSGDLPSAVGARLRQQIDLDLVPTTGLIVFRNPVSLPTGALLPSNPTIDAAISGEDLDAIAALPEVRGQVLRPAPGGFAGEANEGAVYLAQERVPGWRLTGSGGVRASQLAFGWAMHFAPARTGMDTAGSFRIEYGRQWFRTLEVWVLAALWAVALWVTRKPVSAP